MLLGGATTLVPGSARTPLQFLQHVYPDSTPAEIQQAIDNGGTVCFERLTKTAKQYGEYNQVARSFPDLPPTDTDLPKGFNLNIHLYNLAAVSSRTLDHATQDAARVLATAGVDTACWHVLADAPEAHTLHTSPPPTWRKNRQADYRGYIVAVIAHGVPVDYLPGALGYALPDAEIGVNAMIFCDRIERFKASGEIDLPTLLGHAMAHEIGHVLLGTTEHSPAGIMKARWSQADFQVAGLRVMKFTALQRKEILRRRILGTLYRPSCTS